MIVCNINLFDRDQTIYFLRGNNDVVDRISAPIEEIEKVVVQYCYHYNDFSVKIVGKPARITCPIRDKILAQNELAYQNKHPIEVEIIT